MFAEGCRGHLGRRLEARFGLRTNADPQHYGLGFIPWSPLKGGVLGGALAKAQAGRRATENAQKAIAKHKDKLELWEALCARIGKAPADVGVAWLLANPVVTSPIIGPRTPAQLEESMRALELQLAPATMKRLDEIFPGPGGEAPEAYAW